jgi:Gas vesicle protein K
VTTRRSASPSPPDDWWRSEDRTFLEVPAALGRRLEVDPEGVEKGLVQLVLTLVELLRQLMERQAIRRVDAGGLSDDEVERLGTTLMLLDEKMTELREHFGLTPEDLNIDLGPLGRLL